MKRRAWVSPRWALWLTVAGGLLVVAGANAHLVYVALQSQPDCVPHARIPGDGGYRPAKPAC